MDCNLYEMINGTTTPTNNNQMLDDWGLDVIVNGLPHTIDSSFTTTPTNNNQIMLNDWGLDAIVNGFPPTLDASLPSFTTPVNNQMLDDWGLGFYPSHNASSLSSSSVVPTTLVPTIADNNQTLDGNIYWDPAANGFCSNTFMPTPTINNQNWDGFLGPKNSSFEGERLNLYQPMNENNIKQMLQTPNNFSKPPLSTNNWPILTLPIIGKLTDTTTHKQQPAKGFSLGISTCTNMKPHEWKKGKRIYKMPEEAVNNDVWSWRKYGEKSVDGSPYSRVYYKCNSSKKCAAKRRVEQNKSDPDLVTLKYTGHHNHPIPMFMNSPANNNPNPPKASTSTVKSKMNKDDYIFEGLGNFVDLEKST